MMETEAALAKYTALAATGEQETIILPRAVLYHGNINRYDSLYRVDINVPKLSDLYQQESGLSPERIRTMEIHTVGENFLPLKNLTPKERGELFPFGNPFKSRFQKFFGDSEKYAIYHEVKGKKGEKDRMLVVLYPTVIWSDMNKDKKTILAFARKKQRESDKTEPSKRAKLIDDDTEIFKVTKRFLGYLEKASVERIDKFLDRLGSIRANKILLKNVVHEGSHIRQDFDPNANPILKQNWLIDILYFLSGFIKAVDDFLEKKAEQEEERVAKKPEWFDIVNFKTQSPQNTESLIDSPKAA